MKFIWRFEGERADSRSKNNIGVEIGGVEIGEKVLYSFNRQWFFPALSRRNYYFPTNVQYSRRLSNEMDAPVHLFLPAQSAYYDEELIPFL